MDSLAQIILAVIAETVRLLRRAFAGDPVAFARVRHVIPENSELEAKAIHERARLERLKAEAEAEEEGGEPDDDA